MSKKIRLDENYSIVGDRYNWMLVFEEERVKQLLDSNRKPTGEKENYLFEDQWYFATIKQALNKYVNEVTKDNKSVNNLITTINKAEVTINNLEICK